MSTLRTIASLTTAALMAVSLGGCFTGVESTPRIGPPPPQPHNISSSASDSLARAMAALAPVPPGLWQPGSHRLLVDDQRIARTLAPGSAPEGNLRGRILRYMGRIPAISLMGSSATDILLEDEADTTLRLSCRIPLPCSTVDTMTALEIPFTIDLELVERADRLLRGRSLYICTPDWYDADGRVVAGLRHVPVQIDSVAPGSYLYPAAVYFTPRQAADDTPAGAHFVYISIGGAGTRSRGFGQLFSCISPHQRYPGIEPEVWRCIERSRVRPGMTQTECRLALGAPQNIQSLPTRTGMRQIWSYPTGTYLIFDDGLLSDFRR